MELQGEPVSTNRNLIHGIDLTAPGGLDALFAYNRSIYGDLRMEADGGDSGGSDGGAGGEGDQKPADDKPKDGDSGKAGDEKPKGSDGKDFDPDRAKRAIESARESERTAKAKAKAADDQLAAVLKALGVGGDGKPDPEKLNQDLTSAQAATRATKVENAILRRASKAGADGDALLDSRSFLDSLSDLDPAQADFTDKVEDAIKKAVKANARLALPTGNGSTGRSGPALGGNPDGEKKKPATLADAVNARYSS